MSLDAARPGLPDPAPPGSAGPGRAGLPRRGRVGLRVVIVDADRRVRRDLAELVALAPGVFVVGSVGTAEEAVAAVGATGPDVVVVDPDLPEVELGLTLVDRLRADRPELRVVVMSCSGAVEAPALAHGADTFVPKNGQPVVLLDAIFGRDRGARG
ncbi:MAG TPA: response regulator [Candidatus Limnocylindrales bacterium]